jgi:hypothetical protein
MLVTDATVRNINTGDLQQVTKKSMLKAGVNFNNILRAAIMQAYPKSAKRF